MDDKDECRMVGRVPRQRGSDPSMDDNDGYGCPGGNIIIENVQIPMDDGTGIKTGIERGETEVQIPSMDDKDGNY